LYRFFAESSVNLAIYELGTTIDCAVIISARDHVDLAVLSRRNKKLMRFNLPLPEVWAKSTVSEPSGLNLLLMVLDLPIVSNIPLLFYCNSVWAVISWLHIFERNRPCNLWFISPVIAMMARINQTENNK